MMKLALAVILTGLCCLTAKAEDWTVDGKDYHNVTVGKVEADRVHITYDGGIGEVPLADLSPELQKRFGYDPAQAKAVAQTFHPDDKNGKPPEAGKGSQQDLTSLKKELLTAKEDAAAQHVLLESVKKLPDDQFVATLQGLGRVDANMAAIQSDIVQTKGDIENLLKDGFEENHPRIQSLRTALVTEQQKMKELVDGMRRSVAVNAEMADSRVTLLTKEVADLTVKTQQAQTSQPEISSNSNNPVAVDDAQKVSAPLTVDLLSKRISDLIESYGTYRDFKIIRKLDLIHESASEFEEFKYGYDVYKVSFYASPNEQYHRHDTNSASQDHTPTQPVDGKDEPAYLVTNTTRFSSKGIAEILCKKFRTISVKDADGFEKPEIIYLETGVDPAVEDRILDLQKQLHDIQK